MATRVVSLRLQASTKSALRASATTARLSLSGALDWLLSNSIGNFELLRELPDSPERWNSKVDARITVQAIEQLNLVSQRLGISISVYARRLLYHFYVTKRLFYVKSGDRYTLAVRHD
jgi:antitoxin component of RelBE/YafQ-DinJ toxin-antitoxin module